MLSLQEKLHTVFGDDEFCSVCIYDGMCNRGVTGGPNGPIYPPCCDMQLDCIIDEDALDDAYAEYIAEQREA